MIRLLQLQKSEVSFVLTDDAQIHQLNKTYRHMDKPTDVLAFAMREGEHAELAGDALGDVIVSIPTARRQAEERARPLVDEVTMLLAHGLLHLLGWDHDTAAKDRRMRAETDRLCAAADAAVLEAKASKAKASTTKASRTGATTEVPRTTKTARERPAKKTKKTSARATTKGRARASGRRR